MENQTPRLATSVVFYTLTLIIQWSSSKRIQNRTCRRFIREIWFTAPPSPSIDFNYYIIDVFHHHELQGLGLLISSDFRM